MVKGRDGLIPLDYPFGKSLRFTQPGEESFGERLLRAGGVRGALLRAVLWLAHGALATKGM
jgi:hypothetical protein